MFQPGDTESLAFLGRAGGPGRLHRWHGTTMLKCLLYLAAATLLGLTSSQQRLRAEEPRGNAELENAQLGLSFDRATGSLVGLRDERTGVNLLEPGRYRAIWQIDLMPGNQITSIAPSRAQALKVSMPSRDSIKLSWEGFGLAEAPNLMVATEIKLRPGVAVSEWSLALEHVGSLAIRSVDYPRIAALKELGPTEELAVPHGMGHKRPKARVLAFEANGEPKRMEWAYPGPMSLQALAVYQPAGQGLYLFTDDIAAHRKSFVMQGNGDGSVDFLVSHPVLELERQTRYAMPFAAIVGTFTGDWMTVAELYRASDVKKYWAERSLHDRGLASEWVRNTGLWVWNRGRSDTVVAPAIALKNDSRLPVSILWHWWHNGPYDTSYPEYFPPREGTTSMAAALDVARSADVHSMLYLNQRLWCLDMAAWDRESASRFAVRTVDGSIQTETYNTFNPKRCATMDLATSFWQERFAGLVTQALTELGSSGAYLDQAALSLVCYAKDHGHASGGGNYWAAGSDALTQRIRSNAKSAALSGEGAGEYLLDNLDAFLTLQISLERYLDRSTGWDPVPIFQAVYSRHSITYGSYASLTYPPYDELWPARASEKISPTLSSQTYRKQFLTEQARAFTWGMQPMIANFRENQLTERASEIGYSVNSRA